jgi:hypothetical protein
MNPQGLHVVITGSTGMVGEGVLHVCLNHQSIEKVLVINRKSCGVVHPKLAEIIHSNFFDLAPIEQQLAGYDACLFCLGVSSVGMKEPEYFKMTYTLTMHVAKVLSKMNPGMVFNYISGAGTDSSEAGKSMWARVKGKTENDLSKLPFKRTYSFRPGFIKPIPGMKNTLSMYKYLGWLFPVGRALYPKGFCTLTELAKAMIFTSQHDYGKNIIEGSDIIELAQRAT